MAHIATRMLEAGIAASLNLGIDRALLVNGDLTTKAAAKAAVIADAAKLHIAERMLRMPVLGALDLIDNFESGYTEGGDVDDYAVIAGGRAARTKNFWLFL